MLKGYLLPSSNFLTFLMLKNYQVLDNLLENHVVFPGLELNMINI